MEKVPDSILIDIFSYLDVSTLEAAANVNRR